MTWPSGSSHLSGGLGRVWKPPLCSGEVKEGFRGKVAFGLGLNGCVGVLLLSSKLLCPSPCPHQHKLFVQNLCLKFCQFKVRHRVSTQGNQETHPGK